MVLIIIPVINIVCTAVTYLIMLCVFVVSIVFYSRSLNLDFGVFVHQSGSSVTPRTSEYFSNNQTGEPHKRLNIFPQNIPFFQ